MSPPAMQHSSDRLAPHIALLPSAGMGHLAPFLRLAVALSDRGCNVSLIATHPTVSAAESHHISEFFAAYPRIHPLELHLLTLDPAGFTSSDKFFLRFEAIRRSAHLLSPLLSNSEPVISAFVTDISVASTFIPTVTSIGLPCYVLFTASATMFTLCAYFPTFVATKTSSGIGDIDIPGLREIPMASVPLPLHNPNHLFTIQFVENSQVLSKADGILINTFEALEPDALAAINGGKVSPTLPPVLAIGPLQPLSFGRVSTLLWLDEQPDYSVVYVCFGSRTAMPTEQIKELGIGLEKSSCRFLWVVKSKMVDREEDVELAELLGEGYLDRVKGRGLVVKGWVEQEEILRHRAVGGFISHCGWNSVSEAALHGVRILAWPRLGDQRINAEVVKRSGLGKWVEEWSWEGEAEVVKGEEIGKHVRALMDDEGLRASAQRLGKEAAMAVRAGGRSYEGFTEFISKLV